MVLFNSHVHIATLVFLIMVADMHQIQTCIVNLFKAIDNLHVQNDYLIHLVRGCFLHTG